jgi:mannose-1-phosphate guanylyltransferase
MRPMIESWLGENRPKQYCTFVGSRSMLQHTLDRATTMIDPDRIVTVIGRGHRSFLEHAIRQPLPGHLIEQPLNRGTAAGIFLAAAHIKERDPRATVLIIPSDQFVYPEGRFLRYLNHASELVGSFNDQLILLGAVPNRPETEYGWIEPAIGRKKPNGNDPGRMPMAVKSFHEKPGRRMAERLFQNGDCLWNTMVVVVKLGMLWTLGWRYLPEMMRRFAAYEQVLKVTRKGWAPRDHETVALTHTYQYMIQADFSRHILQHTEGWCSVLPLEDVDWCDWGRPDRVRNTLDHYGAEPAFRRHEPPSARNL